MKQIRLLPSGLLLSFLAILVLAACQPEVDLDRPPDIVYGEDVCERCSMIINEARYAAAYVTGDGQAHLFDDIGGMVAYNAAAADDVLVFWVHDFETEEWLKAEDAHYVKSDLMTPMGFGIIAFAGLNRAQTWAAEQGGMVMTFEELLSPVQA
jgi:copper chaperone NosL